MKKKFLLIVIGLIIISFGLIFTGCSEDKKQDNPVAPSDGGGSGETPTPPPVTPTDVFTFIFNGTPKDFSSLCSGNYHTSTSNTFLTARKTVASNYPSIQIIFPGKQNIGTLTHLDGASIIYTTETSNTLNSTSCSITITKYEAVDGRIEGTFFGNVGFVASLPISNGIFNVKRLPDF